MEQIVKFYQFSYDCDEALNITDNNYDYADTYASSNKNYNIYSEKIIKIVGYDRKEFTFGSITGYISASHGYNPHVMVYCKHIDNLSDLIELDKYITYLTKN